MKYWSEQEIEQARRMRNNGATSDIIGEELGRTPAAVRKALAEAGFATRTYDRFSANSPAIGRCQSEEAMIADAKMGSERLLLALQLTGQRP